MEIIANAVQTVQPNFNLLFTDVVTPGSCSIIYREGSGLVLLKGNTNQCRARYKISFGGNMAVPTGGTVASLSIAIALDGEPIPSTTMVVTPVAAGTYNNVYGATFIDVPRGCCMAVSVRNVGADAFDIQNANLIVERVA